MKIKKKVRERKPIVSYTLALSRYEAEVLHNLLEAHVDCEKAPTLESMRVNLKDALTENTSENQVFPQLIRLMSDNGRYALVREPKFHKKGEFNYDG